MWWIVKFSHAWHLLAQMRTRQPTIKISKYLEVQVLALLMQLQFSIQYLFFVKWGKKEVKFSVNGDGVQRAVYRNMVRR